MTCNLDSKTHSRIEERLIADGWPSHHWGLTGKDDHCRQVVNGLDCFSCTSLGRTTRLVSTCSNTITPERTNTSDDFNYKRTQSPSRERTSMWYGHQTARLVPLQCMPSSPVWKRMRRRHDKNPILKRRNKFQTYESGLGLNTAVWCFQSSNYFRGQGDLKWTFSSMFLNSKAS